SNYIMFCSCFFFCYFFFSSRRRHTRCLSDWSSDVCSSDLLTWNFLWRYRVIRLSVWAGFTPLPQISDLSDLLSGYSVRLEETMRSEERRVGKECKYGWSTCD